MITKVLLWKFLQNACTAEERELVARYIEENPGALEEYLGEDDWESFEKSGKLDPSISNRLFSRLEREYTRHFASRKLLKWLAAAACIILLAGIGWNFLLHRKAKTELPALAVLKVDSLDQTNSIRHIKN